MCCDLNWCCVCDKAIPYESESLFCSQECFTKDITNKSTENHKLQYFLYPRTFKLHNNNLPPVPDLSPAFSCVSDSSSPTLPDKLKPFFESADVPKLALGKYTCSYCEKQERYSVNTRSAYYKTPYFH